LMISIMLQYAQYLTVTKRIKGFSRKLEGMGFWVVV